MAVKTMTAEAKPVLWRIGEVAKLTGVTTRTLRYWEELELLQPSSYRTSGERLYSAGRRDPGHPDPQSAGAAGLLPGRGAHGTGHRRRRRAGPDGAPSSRRATSRPSATGSCLDEGIVANDQLLARLDETLGRIHAFHDERAATAVKLRETASAARRGGWVGWAGWPDEATATVSSGTGPASRTRPYAARTARVGVRRR